MTFSSREDIVIRDGLLEHQPHGFHVFSRMSPVPFRTEIAKRKSLGVTRQNASHTGRNLASYKLEAATWGFVVEKNPAARVQPIAARGRRGRFQTA